jgi:hypothetical protein
MKYSKLCLLLCLLIAWPTFASAGKKSKKPAVKEKIKKQAAEVKIMKPYVVFSGVMGKHRPSDCLKITSKNEWAKLWLQSEGMRPGREEYDYYYNTLKVPEIDFDNCMAIAVFEQRGAVIQGSPFGGFIVKEIVEEKKSLFVHLDKKACETVERPDSLQSTEPAGKTTVYVFFVIPRSPNKIILQMDARNAEQHGNNAAPIWKDYTPVEP